MQQNAMNTLSVYKLQQYKGHDGGGVSVFVADAAVCHKDCTENAIAKVLLAFAEQFVFDETHAPQQRAKVKRFGPLAITIGGHKR